MPKNAALTVSAADFLPPKRTLAALREAARECKGCRLYLKGTQTVFGEGTKGAEIMLVGEQPGDYEDREGKPFVGPAGQLLDRCLEQAGIDRSIVYATNAVKHFKWEPRGKRRIGEKPNSLEIAACKPWLETEVDAVRPKLIVCLGATAAQSLLGKSFRVTQSRGELVRVAGMPPIMATVHPASILRAIDHAAREEQTTSFIDDLKKVALHLRQLAQ